MQWKWAMTHLDAGWLLADFFFWKRTFNIILTNYKYSHLRNLQCNTATHINYSLHYNNSCLHYLLQVLLLLLFQYYNTPYTILLAECFHFEFQLRIGFCTLMFERVRRCVHQLAYGWRAGNLNWPIRIRQAGKTLLSWRHVYHSWSGKELKSGSFFHLKWH